jgi:hypothetical protein
VKAVATQFANEGRIKAGLSRKKYKVILSEETLHRGIEGYLEVFKPFGCKLARAGRSEEPD